MIDEKKLIEELESLPLIHGRYDHEHANSDFISGIEAWHETVLKKINEQPKCFEWIPCSDRLPDVGKRYLVSAIWKDKDFEKSAVYDAVYGSDGLWHSYNYEPVSYKVIAWAPLPEPYKERK